MPMSHPKYRRDIDGLRAIAVICVIIYHAFPTVMPGGFIGVDIFFVISGFLISSIIIGNLNSEKFSFIDFYTRRIRRIFPALFIVLVTCAIAGWFLLLPTDYKKLGTHIVAGAAFLSNILLWTEAGYFDEVAALKPLLHLWSLGVEEQFYLIWPFALWLAWRSHVSIKLLIWIIIATSFVINLVLTQVDTAAAFYLPVTRFWELLLGSLMAPSLGLVRASTNRSMFGITNYISRTSIDNGRSLLGFMLISLSIPLLSKDSAFPGWWALLPTIGTYLLISAGPYAYLNSKLLGSRILVLIGTISYPLYLWHWPLLSMARIAESGPVSTTIRLEILAVSLFLAWATYQFVERPFRFGKFKVRGVVIVSVSMTLMALFGISMIVTNGFTSRLRNDARYYAAFKYDYKSDARVGSCWLALGSAPDGFASSCIDTESSNQKPLIVVWGDSHAARFFPGLKMASFGRFRFAEFARSSCPAFMFGYNEYCIESNVFVLRTISKLKPSTVILFGYWSSSSLGSPQGIVSKLKATIADLKAQGIHHIVVMGPAPRWNIPLPDVLAKLQQSTVISTPPERTRQGLDPSVALLDAYMRNNLIMLPDVYYFSTLNALCDEHGCLTRTSDNLADVTTWDYGHLTTAGSELVARKLLKMPDALK